MLNPDLILHMLKAHDGNADDAVLWLSEQWRLNGVRDGSILLIHSNINRTLRNLKRQGLPASPDVILDSLIAAVGDAGTLLLPLFNFDFTKGLQFDIRSTPSQMGALTEAGRMRSEAVRTGHPIYSFAAIGAQASLFEGIDNVSGYSEESPFGILRRQGGDIAVLDLPDVSSMTFYHHVEEVCAVDYRYYKEFSGPYVDQRGPIADKTYTLFVRDIDRGIETDVDPMGELLWHKGHYSGNRPREGSGMRVISAPILFDETETVIRAGKAEGLLYRISK